MLASVQKQMKDMEEFKESSAFYAQEYVTLQRREELLKAKLRELKPLHARVHECAS